MSVFLWTDDFNTGLAAVDEQHRRLVDMLNELDEARTIGSDGQVVLDLLDRLVDYTRYHFGTEEELMRSPTFDRDEQKRHCAEHAGFVNKVADVRSQAQTDLSVIGDDLVAFLVTWLSRHILGTDKQMAALLDSEVQTGADVQDVGTEALIKALRESESRFRGLADSIPALIWMSDASGRRSYFNRQWSEYTGCAQGSLMQGGWTLYLHPDDAARIDELHRDDAGIEQEKVAEFRLRRADERYRWFWETTVPRFRADGIFAGQVGCAIDITERRQVEKLLRSAKRRLESMVAERTQELSEANRVLEQRYREQENLTRRLQETQAQLLHSERMAGIGQLAAGVAHEINNPLGYVNSNLTALKDYTRDLLGLLDLYSGIEELLPREDARRTALDQARQDLDLEFLRQDMPALLHESTQGVRRAKHIVQKLKEFSSLEQENAAPYDLEAGLRNALDTAAKDMPGEVRIVTEFAGLDPVSCVGAELDQVFTNLLLNAAQALDPPGVIKLRSGSDHQDWVWIEVEDNGRGIAEEHMSRLFDPFFTTRPVGQGTGLGLSLSYNVVRKHGGRIEVDSRPGAGSRFRVWLPVKSQSPTLSS